MARKIHARPRLAFDRFFSVFGPKNYNINYIFRIKELMASVDIAQHKKKTPY